MQIKRLSADNIETMRRLSRQFKNAEIDQAAAKRFLDDPANYLIVCLEGDEVAGFVLAYALRRIDIDKNMIYIHEVDVDQKHRQQGCATKMIEFTKAIGKQQNAHCVFVITNRSNEAAMALYRKMGGVEAAADDVVFDFC